jgi:hypothetical protein
MGKFLIQVDYQSLNPKNSFSVLFVPLHSNLLLELEISWRFKLALSPLWLE